jgi:hypothetical protein
MKSRPSVLPIAINVPSLLNFEQVAAAPLPSNEQSLSSGNEFEKFFWNKSTFILIFV